jgi:hypothetical protein
MLDLNLGQLIAATTWDLLFLCPLILIYLISKNKLNKNRFFRFLGILSIATASSLVPFGFFGLIMGFPSALIASIFVSLFLDKE